MQIDIIKNDYTIIRASESIDISNIGAFKAALADAIKDSPEDLIIDLSDAVYIDSAGVQALFNIYKQVRIYGGEIALVAGNLNMKELLEIVNLDRLPGMYLRDDLNSAKQALADD